MVLCNIKQSTNQPHKGGRKHLRGADEDSGHERRRSEEREDGCEGSLEQDQREEPGAGQGQHGGGHEGRRRPPELLEDEPTEDHHDEGHAARCRAEVTLCRERGVVWCGNG